MNLKLLMAILYHWGDFIFNNYNINVLNVNYYLAKTKRVYLNILANLFLCYFCVIALSKIKYRYSATISIVFA